MTSTTKARTVHDLKTVQPFFDDVCAADKNFEVRKDDRNFKVGDWLRLREVDAAGDYTTAFTTVVVTYKLDGGVFGIEPGHCVLGIRKATDDDYIDVG
jgi:hypothetical protein